MHDPFLLLPANLASLANACPAAAEWFALTGVLVKATANGYEAVATNGRILALVQGDSAADPLEYPHVPELVEAPPSQDQAVIPASEWREAFRSVPRGKAVRIEPILGHVAVHLGQQESLLATSDGERASVRQTRNVEGRYPNYEAVLPSDEPALTIVLDPDLLLALVKIARVFTIPDQSRINKLLVVRAANGTQRFVGLQMPMTLEPP
jgi:DNA polymerase III sliding clamp (beta) subunit (PCNA family)